MEERIDMLLASYTLSDLLEIHGIEEHYILKWLIDNDMIDIKEYFDDTDSTEE